MKAILGVFLLAFLFSNNLFSQDNFGSGGFTTKPKIVPEKDISFKLLWQHETIKPGETTHLAVVIDLKKGFHINPPDYYVPSDYEIEIIPTKVTVKEISKGTKAQSPIFQKPITEFIEKAKKSYTYYKEQTIVYIPIRINPDFIGENLNISLEVYYQMCDEDVCFRPATEKLTAEIPINKTTESKQINETIFAKIPEIAMSGLNQPKAPASAMIMLFLALIGGILLNFTPCVLPIIPIKIMGLTNSAGSRSKSILLGLVMSAGIISFWLVLGAMISVIPSFTSISKLFQNTYFTISIGVIIALMAVGMCGLFNVQVPQKIAVLNPRFSSFTGSFGIGIMTAILSTPCTAPFMGASLTWALTQTQLMSLFIFFTIGFGMAAPYMVLSSFPNLIKWMPKSGPVSVVIKETMGILMLAAASYFIGIGLTGSIKAMKGSLLYWWPTMLIVAFAGLWIIIKTLQIKPSALKKSIFVSMGLMIIIASMVVLKTMTSKGLLDWKDYTPELLAKAKKENKIIVLEFTAQWCLNCKVLEKGVLNTKEVAKALTSSKIELIKVDITYDSDVENVKLLNEEGSLTIPYLVIYKNGTKVLERSAYNSESILNAIKD